jgi:hypothetical protein
MGNGLPFLRAMTPKHASISTQSLRISESGFHNEVTQTSHLNSAIGCNDTVLAIQLTGDESSKLEGMWKVAGAALF